MRYSPRDMTVGMFEFEFGDEPASEVEKTYSLLHILKTRFPQHHDFLDELDGVDQLKLLNDFIEEISEYECIESDKEIVKCFESLHPVCRKNLLTTEALEILLSKACTLQELADFCKKNPGIYQDLLKKPARSMLMEGSLKLSVLHNSFKLCSSPNLKKQVLDGILYSSTSLANNAEGSVGSTPDQMSSEDESCTLQFSDKFTSPISKSIDIKKSGSFVRSVGFEPGVL